MTERERLAELIKSAMYRGVYTPEKIAERLIDEGVICPKKIPAYEDYTIDESGNVYSRKSRRYLSQQKRKDGYYYVDLCKNGKRKYFAVHRLVAVTFVENGMNYPQVNHKDEDKTNNNADNLEWCNAEYNNSYGNHSENCKRHRAVVQMTMDGQEIATFDSIVEAEEKTGCRATSIQNCCVGRFKSSLGYRWRYAE